MRIKKFEGTTEKEVIDLVKDELGLDALVLNIRKIQPKGIFSLFRKPTVEVTAAYEEKDVRQKTPIRIRDSFTAALNNAEARDGEKKDGIGLMLKEKKISEQSEKIDELRQKLADTEELLEKAISRLSIAVHRSDTRERKYQSHMLQIFYEALTGQGVLREIAAELLDELDFASAEDTIELSVVIKVVYNKILMILGAPEPLDIPKKAEGATARVIAFIGSTGVGKTTTIAKLSADFVLNRRLSVGLITADTYRIAAVEQLKTYADILGAPANVVHNAAELADFVGSMCGLNDVILIDTAGRSHKNTDNMTELSELLAAVPHCEKFLVLSLTTKYEDLLSIVKAYAALTDFRIIFTKLDETLCYGSILNVCYATGKKVLYVTTGQKVPEDIEVVSPERIAKALLGLGEGSDAV